MPVTNNAVLTWEGVQEATNTPTHVKKECGSNVWDPVKLRELQWEASLLLCGVSLELGAPWVV